LALLAAAAETDPEADLNSLAQLPLGERDRRLFQLRSHTLGPELSCQGACPACGEQLEISVSTHELLQEAASSPAEKGRAAKEGTDVFENEVFQHGDLQLRFRLPTSEDLLAAEAAPDGEEAQRLLVSRCVLEARRQDQELNPEDLTEEDLAALGEHLSALDPLAETLFALTCEACGHGWSQPLEIGEVFLEEIQVLARRLLQEVSWLARGYGWSEDEILRLTPARRRAYLEMLWA